MFKSLTPNLMVEDVDKSIAWYTDVFAAETTASVPYTADTTKLQWASIQIGEVELMLQLRASLQQDIPEFADKPIGASLSFYIHVEDLDTIYARLKEKNVEIIVDLNTTFYGAREVTIKDCNGYVLTLSGGVAV